MADLFIVEGPPSPWGDYGHILVHGLVSRRSAPDAPLELERTGPFLPPITMPGHLLLDEGLRIRFEASGPQGIRFRPVIKKRIVHLDWHLWDRQAAAPQVYPRGGEPANYVLGRKHHQATADAIGPVWELLVPVVPGLQLDGGRVLRDMYIGQAVCRGRDTFSHIYVSVAMRDFLSTAAPEWVRFRVAEFGDAA